LWAQVCAGERMVTEEPRESSEVRNDEPGVRDPSGYSRGPAWSSKSGWVHQRSLWPMAPGSGGEFSQRRLIGRVAMCIAMELHQPWFSVRWGIDLWHLRQQMFEGKSMLHDIGKGAGEKDDVQQHGETQPECQPCDPQGPMFLSNTAVLIGPQPCRTCQKL